MTRLVRVHFKDKSPETRPIDRVILVDGPATAVQASLKQVNVRGSVDVLLIPLTSVQHLQVFEGEFTEVDRQQRR